MFNRRASHARHFQSRDGNSLPRHSSYDVAQGQSRVLSSVYGHLKKPSEQLAADSGVCPRAARNHLSGANCMNLTDFFNACLAIPELRSWGAKMMGLEMDRDPSFDADLHKLMRAYYERQTGRASP